MTEQRVRSKAELIAAIERSWEALQTALAGLSEAQLTGPRDDQGWNGRDHLIHLCSWERSVIALLQGRPRYEGLGMAPALYLQGDEDAVNAAIQQEHQALPLSETLQRLRATHEELLQLLGPLTDAELQRPYRHFLPEEAEDGGERSALDVIFANSAHHVAEHLPWIKALAGLAEA